MSTKPRVSRVETILDDAALARITATDAVMRLQTDVIHTMRDLRAILASSRVINESLDEIMGSLYTLRQLHPTARGQRSDLTDQAVTMGPVAA